LGKNNGFLLVDARKEFIFLRNQDLKKPHFLLYFSFQTTWKTMNKCATRTRKLYLKHYTTQRYVHLHAIPIVLKNEFVLEMLSNAR
jgi:hypothetical protein